MKVIPKNTIHLKRLDKEILLYDEKKDKIHVLNEPASIIWDMLSHGSTEQGICQKITSQFKVENNKALSDIQKTISGFKKLKLINS